MEPCFNTRSSARALWGFVGSVSTCTHDAPRSKAVGVQLAEAGKEHRGVHLVEFLFLGFAGGACSGAN